MTRDNRCGSCSQHELVDRLTAENHRLKVALFDAQQAASTRCHTCKDEGYLGVGMPCTDCNDDVEAVRVSRTRRIPGR